MIDAELAIRLAVAHDARPFARHIVRHLGESGTHGLPVFAPVADPDFTSVYEQAAARWSKGLKDALWGRAWLAWRGEDVVGHVELRGGRIPAEMHRATLGMGVERACMGRGLGRKLLEIAMEFAQNEARLGWVDLGVFVDNAPARRLYESAGFSEVGTRVDSFRTEGGHVIDEIFMVKRLAPP